VAFGCDIQTAKHAALAEVAADYVPKPFGVDHLMNKLRSILSDL
jgi:DNA-binding response OmpR family regulator